MEAAAVVVAGDRPIVIFDGMCNLCDRTVQFILDHDRPGRLLLCASQSDAGAALLARFAAAGNADRTVLLVEGDQLYARSAAALRIARSLGFPWSLLFAFVVVPSMAIAP